MPEIKNTRTYMDKSKRHKNKPKPKKRNLNKSKEPPENRLLDVDTTSGYRPTRRLV